MRNLSPILIVLLLGCPGPGDPDPESPTEPPTDEPTPEPIAWPATLAATGLYADLATETLAEGVIPFEVAWPLWSDGASKDRFLWLPDGAVIDTSNPDLWDYPIGTRAWKHFSRDGVRVETRFIERTEQEWVWIAYQWRKDVSDADPVPSGVTDASGTDHDIPSTYQCALCHTSEGFLGINPIQLGDDNPASTLEELDQAGLLSTAIEGSTAVPGEGTVREVLGYFHGNCGGCHVDHFWLADEFTLRLRVLVGTETPEDSLAYLTAIDAPTTHTTTTTVAVAPGDPEASQVYERMGQRTSPLQMPPLGTELVDEDALARVHAWIMGLPPSED